MHTAWGVYSLFKQKRIRAFPESSLNLFVNIFSHCWWVSTIWNSWQIFCCLTVWSLFNKFPILEISVTIFYYHNHCYKWASLNYIFVYFLSVNSKLTNYWIALSCHYCFGIPFTTDPWYHYLFFLKISFVNVKYKKIYMKIYFKYYFMYLILICSFFSWECDLSYKPRIGSDVLSF